jgi:hypothetical protein
MNTNVDPALKELVDDYAKTYAEFGEHDERTRAAYLKIEQYVDRLLDD